MKELQAILHKIDHLEQQGKRFALATVVKVSGSTYRRPGARMLITEDGETIGAVSGGCLEGDVYQRAQQLMSTGTPQLVTYDTTSPEDIFWGTGMGCGGVTHVLIDPFPEEAGHRVLKKLRESLQQDHPVVLATVFRVEGNLTVHPGDMFLVDETMDPLGTVEHSRLRETLLARAREVFRRGRSANVTIRLPEGEAEVLLEALMPPLPLIIFGGGQDVFPVIDLARILGWRVTVVEYREALAVKERFPAADRVLLWAEDAPPAELTLDSRTVCVIMTHHYLTDKKILRHLLPSPVSYIGFLGPKQRARQLLNELREEGVSVTDAQLQRLYSPVGLDIGAETAEEVAFSIIAEIQAVLSHRRGGFLRERKGAIHGTSPEI
ncbi:MAG: XdhC/CoxI family protein [Calditrichaeota bacterium]|nr:MAG: XdhC/CoxI family protein [Calditrichota bacterium]